MHMLCFQNKGSARKHQKTITSKQKIQLSKQSEGNKLLTQANKKMVSGSYLFHMSMEVSISGLIIFGLIFNFTKICLCELI